MLRFIKHREYIRACLDKFQYIQCYGSSMALSRKSTAPSHFNTSNVTVHPGGNETDIPKKLFQYIQCYGSSALIMDGITISLISIHPMLRFIAIADVIVINRTRFQYIQCYGSSRRPRYGNQPIWISIHPMLRFIAHGEPLGTTQTKFQYIQCYGSSRKKLTITF